VAAIEQNFVVERPVEVVWHLFQDVAQVAGCMPGVELLEVKAADEYVGKMKVKLGPIAAEFSGEAKITDVDPAAHTGRIRARGVDRRGGSRASANVTYSVTPAENGSRIDLSAEISLQGAMAQFGRTGLIQEVSGHLTQQFADCLQQKLAATTPEESADVRAGDVSGLKVLWQGVLSWVKSRLGRLRTSK
jgi:carbon monoxide dehydrogenase subunit G